MTSAKLASIAAALSALTAMSFVAKTAAATTLQVGSGKMYATPCAAIAAAAAGDVIQVDAGTYNGDTCAWTTDNLTVTAVGGRAKIDISGMTPNQQKGIFTISAPNATLENFELSGAAISADAGNNGAGIRHQGMNLTLRGMYIHDNQDGILGGPLNPDGSDASGNGTILIDGCEFSHNGAGDGQSHNLYLNHYGSVTMMRSYSHDANVGHLFKSRALVTSLFYNRLTDETGGEASYEVDLPNAGTAFLVGNAIEQSATTMNSNIVSYGEESAGLNADHHLYMVNNTIVNDDGSGQFVTIGSPSADATVLLENNLFAGPGTMTNAASPTLTTNLALAIADAKLTNATTYDYTLVLGSPAIDSGTTPAAVGSQSVDPSSEYISVGEVADRTVVGVAIDVGAYEYGVPLTVDDGGVATTVGTGSSGGTDGGTATGSSGTGGAAGTSNADGGSDRASGGGSNDSSGCSVTNSTDASSGYGLAALVGLACVVATRRRRASR